VAEAERNREEDARIRQLIDARNELDGVAYQVSRTLEELGDRAPQHERARAEMLVADARQAIKEEAPLDRLRSLTGELQQVQQGLRARAGQPGGGPEGGGAPGGQEGRRPGDDDVIDADFTRE
jgi:molecular chaperone DnaK